MTEPIDERVSEFVDDEMSAEECHFFVRRLQRDGDARARFVRYQLIGAALRGEHRRPDDAGSLSGLAGTGAEPADEATGSKRIKPAVPQMLVGAGIAACFVLVAVFGLGSGPLAGIFSQDREIIGAAPENDVTDVQYLIHHMGYSSTLNRSLMHSNVFSDAESDIDADILDEFID